MPIDFTRTPAQVDLQRSARKFARTVLVEVAAATRNLQTPLERFVATRPMYEEMIRAGFLRRMIPAPLGGEGTGMVDMALVAEEFYAVDASVSLTLFATLLGLLPVVLAGSPEQQREFIQPFLKTTGAPLAALANTEPGGSANYASPSGEGVRTQARLVDDEWVINGTKQWISSATGWDENGADLLCVVCRTDPDATPEQGISVIAVPRPDKGIVVESYFDPMGHRAHLVPRFRLDKVRVPAKNVLGPVGAGKTLVDASFTGTAALVGVFGTGLMQAAFNFALEFARTERRAGGVPIIEHQAVGYALADAKAAIEASRYLNWKACHALDTQDPGAIELALHAKIFGSPSH